MNVLTVKKITPCKYININETLNRFVQFVDVSQLSVRAYISGVRAFIRFIHDNGINNPTRDNVLTFKKELTATKSPV